MSTFEFPPVFAAGYVNTKRPFSIYRGRGGGGAGGTEAPPLFSQRQKE